MSETATLSLPAAARTLGVPVRVLRQAIRAGRIPAPPHLTATTPLSAEWLASAQGAAEASPKTFSAMSRQKAPPFAHYEGTSAWRKYSIRVREYQAYKAAAKPVPAA